jgi:hypothetical protein
MSDAPTLDVEPIREIVGPRAEIVGWATVELDRAERELARWGSRSAETNGPEDEILGARCRVIETGQGERLVLLEPSTEGPLAAALVRHGEGPVARYLVADAAAVDRLRATGLALSAEASGPLGRERRVLGGPRWGPFILIVTEQSGDS